MADRVDYAVEAIASILKMLSKADRRLVVTAMTNVQAEMDGQEPVKPEPIMPRLTVVSGGRP